MARIALTCSCGWNFFVPGSTPGHEVSCPSCTRSVPIPGRKPGKDYSDVPSAIAARAQLRHSLRRLLMVLVVAGAAGAGYCFWKRSAPVDDAPGPADASGRPARPASPTAANPPTSRPGPASAPRAAALRRRVQETIWLVNMASIVSECLRFRNLAREWSQLRTTVGSYEAKVKADLAELAAANEKIALEPFFAEGDRIVAFGPQDLTAMKRADAAQVLHAWMNAWRPGPALQQVEVERDEKRVTLYLQFPEDTKELLLLLRHAYLQLPPEPDRDPAPAPAISDPEAVAKAVEALAAEVTSRSEGFNQIVEEMRRRTESMTTTAVPVWPDESVRGIALIGNPLTFKATDLSPKAAQELALWWNGLAREERTRFAAFFGLWCANTRAKK